MIDTIGQRLKKAREYRGLTLEKAAEATRIRQGYLRALETDDFSALPSPVQARGFLRNYAQYLNLDLEQVVEELRATQATSKLEVFFEGEQAPPAPMREEVRPQVKAEEPLVETASEPFWQTWLRRAKSEGEQLDRKEDSGSQRQPFPAPSVETSPTLPAQRRGETNMPPSQATGQAEGVQNGARPAKGAKGRDISVAPGPDTTLEPEAGQRVGNETVKDEAGEQHRSKTKVSLLERIKSRFLHKQVKPVPVAEPPVEPEPNPEPKPVPEPPRGPAPPSQAIINEIGMQLRRRREMLSLTLDEIERHTRLRVEIMDALERGDFDDLPSPVQTRGMLANYAGFLDLEVDALLLRFADALQARHRERHPEKPARRRGQPNIPENLPTFRTLIAGDVIFGVGMVLLLIGFSVWGISRVIALQSEQDSGTQDEASGPSISEALIGTPVQTVVSEVTLIPAEDTPIPGQTAGVEGVENTEAVLEIPTLTANGNVQVNIVALERSFLRVAVDGELVFEGRTIPGNAYPFEAEQSIEVLTGNGSALRVIYNQRDMGLLGGFGQIASYIYTADEILVPTPVVSPTTTSTPFISPTPSITPSPTITPTPTRTPISIPVTETGG